MSEISQTLASVNPKKKKKGAAKKKAKKTGGKKTRRSSGAGKKSSSKGRRRARRPAKTKGRRRSSRRTRNPGVDWKGTGAAFVGGVAGYLVGQPATAALEKIESTKVKKILRPIVGGLVPTAIGVGVQYVGAPNIGKGMVGAGGALAAGHTLAALATMGEKPNETMEKLGFTKLAGPGDVFVRDGQYYRNMGDGTQQLLMNLPQGAAPVVLQLEDGTQARAQLLGSFPSGDAMAVVDGQFVVLPRQALGEFVKLEAGPPAAEPFVRIEGIGSEGEKAWA